MGLLWKIMGIFHGMIKTIWFGMNMMNLVDLSPSHGMFFSGNDHKTLGFRPTALRRYGQVQLITSKPTELALDWAILSRPAELVPSIQWTCVNGSSSGGTSLCLGIFCGWFVGSAGSFLLCAALFMVFFLFLKNKRESRSVVTFQEKKPHKGFRAHRSIGQYHIYIETLCCQDGNS